MYLCKLLCFCAQYIFIIYRLEIVVFLCTVHVSDIPLEIVLFLCSVRISDIPSINRCVSVLSTHFCCTVSKMLCFCSQYTFLIHLLEIVVFLCSVHISDIPFGNCCVSVLSSHFWCTVLKVLFFCAQYTFLFTVYKLLYFCSQGKFLTYLLERVFSVQSTHF